MKETAARLKINKLLEAAGWQFFIDGSAPANIREDSCRIARLWDEETSRGEVR